MKSELVFWLFSSRILTREAASLQIGTLANFGGGAFRPDRWGDAEPLRTPFDQGEPIERLAAPQGAFLFRGSTPKKMEGQIWNLHYPSETLFDESGARVEIHEPPFFCTRWTFAFGFNWILSRVGMSQLVSFAEQAFASTGADFAFLTKRDDLEAKNYIGGIERCGTDPATGIPGLYWLNFFSNRYADWIGLNRTEPDPVVVISQTMERTLLQFGAEVGGCRDDSVLEAQARLVHSVGHQKFFDISHRDRSLEVPPWKSLGRL